MAASPINAIRRRTWNLVGVVCVPKDKGGTAIRSPPSVGKEMKSGGAALHADRRKRIAARTGVRPLPDAVAKIVAKDLLNAVCEICDEYGVRSSHSSC